VTTESHTATGRKAISTVYEPQSFVPLLRFEIDLSGKSKAQPSGPEVLHYHCNHIGTPEALIDRSGQIVWQAEFDPWGNLRSEYNPQHIQQTIRMQGQHADSESKLLYNRYRYYGPSIGRYITQDPIRLKGGANFYSYADGSATNFVDPMGLIVQVCTAPAFDGNIPFDHYWIKTDTYEAGMGADGRGVLGTGATIVSHAGRSAEPGASCRNPKVEVDEACVNRLIEATLGEEFGHWFPPFNYCKTFVGWVFTQCQKKSEKKK
jgi:RHS repeat-associated protein